MKKIFFISLLFVMTASFATAQQRTMPSAEERAKNQTERLDKLLELNSEQKTKIQAINLELAKKMDEQMAANRGGGDREAMMKRMREMDTERSNKYKEVLTAEQFKKYTEDREKREKEMRERRAQRQRN
jgi:Spy/CpxP family protein refolding chaperone